MTKRLFAAAAAAAVIVTLSIFLTGWAVAMAAEPLKPGDHLRNDGWLLSPKGDFYEEDGIEAYLAACFQVEKAATMIVYIVVAGNGAPKITDFVVHQKRKDGSIVEIPLKNVQLKNDCIDGGYARFEVDAKPEAIEIWFGVEGERLVDLSTFLLIDEKNITGAERWYGYFDGPPPKSGPDSIDNLLISGSFIGYHYKGYNGGPLILKPNDSVSDPEVVTPAPGEVITTETIFTIGSTTYLFNGVEQTMDIAPYIKDGRTFLPLRFVARATGVRDENILFDQEHQTVTMIKGDRVVITTIGSNILRVNGALITLDTAPELIDPPGRTMFPIRWIATALGCNVDWNEDTQEVTVY